MQTKSKSTTPRKRPAPPAFNDQPKPGELPDPPLSKADPPEELPMISQREIVAYITALELLQFAKADLEAKRGGLVLKLLHFCHCEVGSYIAYLDEAGNLVTEDRSSISYPTAPNSASQRYVSPSSGPA
jgi:hypothetical protein